MSVDDVNTSMAGLSDYSMSDIQKLDGDDDSMAQIDTSMADIDEEKNKPQEKKGSNILDGLKLDMGRVGQQNLNDSKFAELKGTYRASEVFDENDEDYDSEGDEERKSFKKAKRPNFKDLLAKKKESIGERP